MDDETFQALRGRDDWGEVGKKLLAVAINYARKYPSIGYQTCDDIVQSVIDKALRGEPTLDPDSGELLPWRTWKPDRGELLPWLKWCVKSEIDNTAKKLATKNELLLIDLDDERDDFGAGVRTQKAVVPVSESLSKPETALLHKEKEVNVKQKITSIYETVTDDEELEELVLAMDCLLDDHEAAQKPSRRELAEYIEIAESEVNNRMKRLRRRLLKVGLVK